MSIDLTIDSDYIVCHDFVLAPPINYGCDWNGREIAWRDLPEVRFEMERRITQVFSHGGTICFKEYSDCNIESDQGTDP